MKKESKIATVNKSDNKSESTNFVEFVTKASRLSGGNFLFVLDQIIEPNAHPSITEYEWGSRLQWFLPSDSNDFICHLDILNDGHVLFVDDELEIIKDDFDDLDSEDDEPTSYSQTWQNTGMSDQPIYYFHTRSKDGHLGDAIGTIMIEIPNLKDTTFYVVGHGDSVTLEVEFEHGDSDNPYRYEYEFSRNLEECRDLWLEITDIICDVQNYGRGAIYSNSEEVINCIKNISDKLDLGYVFEERYCEEEMSEYIGVYSADMASKMYLGKNVDFAFRLDVAQSMVADNENAHCDFQLHDVIMEYPNGDLDRDKGYVIFFDTEE